MTPGFMIGLGLLGVALAFTALNQPRLWLKSAGTLLGVLLVGGAVWLSQSAAPVLSDTNPDAGSAAQEAGMLFVANDDAEINASVGEAQKTLPQFIEALAKPQGRQGFGFKYGVPVDDSKEFMWFNNVTYAGGQFSGTLANDPEWATMHYGERLTVSARDIADWKYVDSGVMRGAYSIRIFRQRMTLEERDLFDREAGARFEN
ncbi:DUF2314 domain-containing protein [Deinococcus sp.]|uniref:DUF2314 domain-containing protein n=1 Tax=Deinococcus sp. TaxID=47478 RepID=UPI003B58D20D